MPVLTRRTALHSLIAGSLALSPLTRLAAMPGGLDNPNTLLTAFMRLAGSLDDRLVIWWMDGMRYGVVDAHATLMYGMKVGMFHRFFRQPDGSFKVAMFELTYYTDLETGTLLESYDNPYTGETNRVVHVRLGPEIRHQTAAGIADPDDPMVRDFHSGLGPALIRGDDVWIPTDVEATIKFPKPAAPEIVLNHYTTVHGRLSDAVNSDIVSARAEIAFQNILRWEPWMRMGEHPGHMMSRAAGMKLESLEDLPDDYLEMARRVHPKLIADPLATLEKLTRQLA